MSKIEWRIILEFPNYLVNNTGIIKNRKTGKILKPIVHEKYGHLYFYPKRSKKLYIHRAVLITFSRNPKENEVCRHLDGNPKNNNINNLKLGTHSENAQDSIIHGTRLSGDKAKFSKLTNKDALDIRILSKTGESSRKLANKYNVSHTTIQKIVREERYVR